MNRPQFERFQKYQEMLRKGPCSCAELATAGCVKLKTMQRDREYLQAQCGWQFTFDGSSRKWSVVGEMRIPMLHLTDVEGLALLVAAPALRAYGETPYASALRSALDKVIAAMDSPVETDGVPVQFGLQAVRETDPRLFELFSRAVRRRDRLHIRYYSPDNDTETERDIDPVAVINHDGGWYVVGWCHLRRNYRDFALSRYRVKEWRHTGEQFAPRTDFDLAAYCAGAFGAFKGGVNCEVVLRFARSQAVYQRERVPRSGEVREATEDGGLLVRFEAPFDRRNPGLLRWVLQYGSEVEVLAPAELREQVRAEGERMLGVYGKDSK